MKTAILLLAIAVMVALIALVVMNARIRDLQHQMHRQRKRIARLKQKQKPLSEEERRAAFIKAAESIVKELEGGRHAI